MAKVAKKTDPKLWDKVKTDVTEGDKDGRPGQWSARKSQLASQEYKKVAATKVFSRLTTIWRSGPEKSGE